MASFNSYTGNGVTQNRAITFPYIHTTHVHAYLDGVETEAWTWFDSSTIQFTVAPGNGVAILIQRETPTDERLAEFTNGEALLDEELNISALQALYVAEEAKDRANQSIAVNALNRYDFGGRRATNAADPVDAQDLVTKTWAETNGTSVLAQTITAKNTALAAATAAEAAEAGSEAAQDVAVAAATSADADATATAADRVVVAADKATVAADKGTVAADKAIVAADKATVAADKGTVAADKATVAADKGTVAADKAIVAADKATTQGYRDEAETFRDEAQAAAGGVKVTSADTTAGKLNDKITVSGLLSKATGSPGGNETLDLSVKRAAGDLVISFDSTPPSDAVELDGSTITGGAATFPGVAARYPWMVVAGDIKLPDTRGKFLRGWAHGSSNDPDRASRSARVGDGQAGDFPGTNQADQIKAHNHSYLAMPNGSGMTDLPAGSGHGNSANSTGDTGGNETRPININVMYCMVVG